MAKIGFVFTASYCTFSDALLHLTDLKNAGHDIFPIASENSVKYDTRFGEASKFKENVENITEKKIVDNIVDAEQFGPKNKLDAIIIVPATGNFIAKLANGITDNAALMATKATLRNGSPVIIGISTNDALGANGPNIFGLLNRKNIFFIPFGQDDYENKPNSLISHYDMLIPTLDKALVREQIQPVLKDYVKAKTLLSK